MRIVDFASFCFCVTFGALFSCVPLIASQTTSSVVSSHEISSIKDEDKKFLDQSKGIAELDAFLQVEKVQNQVVYLYQLMKIVDQILSDAKITYWAESGTVLGAYRHGAIIPWDDDIDLSIPVEDEERLVKLIPVFRQYGIELYESSGIGYKIRRNFTVNGIRYPLYIDIFMRKKNEKGIWDFSREPSRRTWPTTVFHESEVFPLRPYQLGPIVIWGPQNGEPHLIRAYGNKWKNEAYFDNHIYESDMKTMHKHHIFFDDKVNEVLVRFYQNVNKKYGTLEFPLHQEYSDSSQVATSVASSQASESGTENASLTPTEASPSKEVVVGSSSSSSTEPVVLSASSGSVASGSVSIPVAQNQTSEASKVSDNVL